MAKKSSTKSITPESSEFLDDLAEQKKRKFIELVRHLSQLRDVQYVSGHAESVVKSAEKVVACNLPSNLLRAAAIFVDYRFGFPADQHSFFPPQWVGSEKPLPAEERGSLVCDGFREMDYLEEKDVVVLTADMPVHGLHAGMAGIVRRLPDDEANQGCLVEFGEPHECVSVEAEVPLSLLRRPRPGDLIENYCL